MKKQTTKQKAFNTKKANRGHIRKSQRRRLRTAIKLQQEKMEKLYRRGFVPYTPPVVEEPVETKENKKSDDETVTL
ncbi:hypothetical protein N9N08_00120 [bacterium]|nr:hypothetical protein [bacterium]